MTATFGFWDYVVFGVMLVASLCIGVYHAVRGRNQTTSEYLVAGGSMTFVPVALSLIATFESSVMMLGTPAEGYVYGVSWILGQVGNEVGEVLTIVLVLVFVRRLKVTTPFEYIERRFQSRLLRVLATIMACCGSMTYISLVLYGQSIAIQAVTGFSIYSSILLTTCAAVFYTTLGGLKGVIWADVLQFFVMIAGLVAVTIMGTIKAGGTTEVWTMAAESGRLGVSLDLDPTVRHTVWNLLIGRILGGVGLVTSIPTLQRISAMKSLKHAKWALFLAVPGGLLITATSLAEGVVAYGYFSHKRCDPLKSKQIQTPNQIIPYMIMDLFNNLPGMPGLFLAALSSASLSTISSLLSGVSMLTWVDLVKPNWPHLSDFKGLLISKAAVVVFGAIGGFMAAMVSLVGARTLNQIAYTFQATVSQPLVGFIYLGSLFSFVNVKGALTGYLTGFAFMLWLALGSMFSTRGGRTPYYPLGPTDQCSNLNLTSPLTNMSSFATTNSIYSVSTESSNMNADSSRSGLEAFYGLSYTLFSAVSLLVVMVVGTIASILTGGLNNRADPELVIHKSDILFFHRENHRRPVRKGNGLVGQEMLVNKSLKGDNEVDPTEPLKGAPNTSTLL